MTNWSQLLSKAMKNDTALLRADKENASIAMRGVFLSDDFAGHRAAITTTDFENAIDELGITPGAPLTVEVDSIGGQMPVSQWLMREISKYDTTVVVRARLYSAATHMALGARRVVGVEGSDYLYHYPWTMALGNYRDLEKYASELREAGDTLVQEYLKRATIEERELRDLMAEDKIIPAAKALEIGLIDEIVENSADDK